MKCQILISDEHKKIIIKLLSAELAKSSQRLPSLAEMAENPIEAFLLKNVFMDK